MRGLPRSGLAPGRCAEKRNPPRARARGGCSRGIGQNSEADPDARLPAPLVMVPVPGAGAPAIMAVRLARTMLGAHRRAMIAVVEGIHMPDAAAHHAAAMRRGLGRRRAQ